MTFEDQSIAASSIRTAQEYGGVRVTLTSFLGRARIPLQVDIGYGDAITPPPEPRLFPTLLPLPAPLLRTYPLETVVAEKFEAIARLGLGNSRMKDFRDLLMLVRRRDFDGPVLARAVRGTFAVRRSRIEDLDDVLTPTFFRDQALETRWRAYRRQQPDVDHIADSFQAVGDALLPFLLPLAEALRGADLDLKWAAGVGWR
ncbi:MAG: nucleotidyl transferase AbiEii/AbiGii toxin family protein [Planctomycetes bacterium]|nr:nucleotidyl transferase AbiEii/AbiGii toxin family protein [Planctomycetota bacterium]